MRGLDGSGEFTKYPSNCRMVIVHERHRVAVTQRLLELGGPDNVREQKRDQPGPVLVPELLHLSTVVSGDLQIHQWAA